MAENFSSSSCWPPFCSLLRNELTHSLNECRFTLFIVILVDMQILLCLFQIPVNFVLLRCVKSALGPTVTPFT